jgi:shikimate kinase
MIMTTIFLIGYMGCGKTTLGKQLAMALGHTFVDLDSFIEAKYHKSIACIFEDMGQDKFREIERNALAEVAEFENAVIATGGGAPCFFDNIEKMNKSGLVVYIRLTPAQIAARLELTVTGTRPLIAGKKGDELLQFIELGLKEREAYYMRAAHIFDGSDDFILEKICDLYQQESLK